MPLTDGQIAILHMESRKANGLISHFCSFQVNKDDAGNKIISYGLSSMGYDLRLGRRFCYPADDRIIDPKDSSCTFKSIFEVHKNQSSWLLEPGEFILAETYETVSMPDDVLGICIGKSTYARAGLYLNTTPIEPGWTGKITLELSNPTKNPIKIYPGEGICQLIFFRGSERPMVTYGDRGGKYQNQPGIVLPKV